MNRKVRKPTNWHRAKLIEYHGNNRATFQCDQGHEFKSSVMPKDPRGRTPDETMCAFMARRWQNTGVRMDCPKCKRERNAHVANPFREIVNTFASAR